MTKYKVPYATVTYDRQTRDDTAGTVLSAFSQHAQNNTVAVKSTMAESSSSSSSPFRSDCLQGRVALVTGGGSGIGFSVTRELLRAGCAGAVICGRRRSFLEAAAAALQAELPTKVVEFRVCDVRRYETCEAAVEFCRRRFGRLDILVNGAAGNFLAQASQLSPKGFATVMSIDALGTFHMSRAAHALLKETAQNNNDGTVSIVNISATLQYGATWWQAHASAAKAAVDSLTRSLALEWAAVDRIRVNGIAPGPIADTPGTTKLAPVTAAEEEDGDATTNSQAMIDELVAERIPLGRMGEAAEIGHAAVYLAAAPYVTGHTVVVDGGEWLYKGGEPWVPQEMVAQLSRRVEAVSRSQAPTATTTTSTTAWNMQSRL